MSNRYWNFERYRTSGQSFAMAMLFALVAGTMVAMNWGLPPKNYSLAASMAAIAAFHLWLGIRAHRREQDSAPNLVSESGG